MEDKSCLKPQYLAIRSNTMALLSTFLRRALLAPAAFVWLLSCNNDTTEPAGVASDNSVNLTTTSLGQTLTGVDGKTLYFFAADADGKSACTSFQCLANWYTFYADKATLQVGTGLNAADFGEITRADGRLQTTYKGWPLYYFKNDAKAGDVLGENVGNVWFVAKPNYTVMLTSAQLTGHDGKNYTTANTVSYTEGLGSTLYLTDAKGRTLYGFNRDKKNVNNYTRSDFSNNAVWPLFEVAAASLGDVPSALKKSDFSSIKVFGRDQLTYKGWPLYYFDQDLATRGLNKGITFPRLGVWPIVNATTPEAPAQ